MGGLRLAVKVLGTEAEAIPTGEWLDLFKREFEVLAGLRHPRLASVHDLGSTADGRVFFSRDFVVGDDLLTASAGMGLREFVSLAVEVCRALEPLHRAGLVHGDIKPRNAIIGGDGVARLIDFSFARPSGAGAIRRGTGHYMAPEVIEERTLDVRSDIYSLGVAFFEMVGGAPPFEGSIRDVLAGHLRADRPVLTRSRIGAGDDPGVAGSLAAVIGRMISRRPEDRFPDIEEVEAALTAVAPDAVRPDPVPQQPVLRSPWGADARVRDLCDAVAARLESPGGRDSLHVVEGAPGTGKTAVRRTLKWRVQLLGASVIEAGCSGGGLLDPVVEIVRQAADRVGPDPRDAAVAAALLSSLERSVGGGFDLEGLSAAAADLLSRAAAAGPLVVSVEDVDQASPETLAVLGSMAARAGDGEPLAYLVTARAGFDWRRHIGEGRGVVLPLMGREEIRGAVVDFFGAARDDAVDRIMEHTGGNPLFVFELLADLFAAQEGLEHLEKLGPPRRIEAYWAERTGALSPDERAVVEASAVFGREAPAQALAALTGLDAGRVEEIAGALGLSGWLRRGPGGISVATVPMAREVVAHADADRLAILHRRAMDEEPDEARRLMHAAACGETGPLAERGLEVAATLERMGALFAAANLLGAMEAALGEKDGGARIRVALGRVAVAQGDHRAAVEWLEPLVGSGDPEIEERSRFLLGRARLLMRDLDGAAEMLTGALALAGSDPAGRARVLAELSKVELGRGNPELAADAARQGLDLGAGGDGVRADLLGLLGNVAAARGEHRQAISFCEEAVAAARGSQEPRALALSMDRLAWARQQSGDYAGAIEVLTGVAALYREIGDMRRLARAVHILGDLRWEREEWGESLARYEEASRLVRSVGNPAQSIEVRTGLGWALTTVGRFERAALVLAEAKADAERSGFEELALRAVVFEGDLAACHGRTEEALSRWAVAREGLDRPGRGGVCAELELEMAETRLWRRSPADIAEAGRLVEAARGRKRDDLGRRFVELLALVEGILALARGRFDEGMGILDGLVRDLAARGGLDLTWQAHLAVARAMIERGADVLARKRLREAERILARLAARLPSEHRIAFWQDVRRAEVRRLLAVTVPSSRIEPGSATEGSREGGLDPEAAALYRVLAFNKRLSTEPDLDRLMSAILDAAIELTGAERGFVLTPEGRELAVKAAREMGSATTRDPHAQFSRSIAESVLLDGEAIVTIDATGDHRFSEFLSIHELQIRSVACVPVIYRGAPLGVVYLENRLRRGRFDGRDLRVLTAFADQVAVAISQARLLEDLRARGEQLEEAREALEGICARQEEDLRSKKSDLRLVEDRLERVRQRVEGQGDYHGVIGAGPRMRTVFDLMERVKDLDVPVVFVGESGTGKDLLARVLHDVGRRRLGPFVALACGAVPETLVEATLFGHIRGAFSGADSERTGVFAAAAGGTLYLDDIGEMPPRMQVDLLRVLQEGCYSPLGGNSAIRADFRLLASSRESPEELAGRGLLRRDLLYRLQVLGIELPPLRDRAEDIPALARRIAGREAARLGRSVQPFSPDALDALAVHRWAGNVRELEQVIRRALVISDADRPLTRELLFGPLPAPERRCGRSRSAVDGGEGKRILDALEECQWNRSRAAQLLGIPRRTFYRRLEALGLTNR